MQPWSESNWLLDAASHASHIHTAAVQSGCLFSCVEICLSGSQVICHLSSREFVTRLMAVAALSGYSETAIHLHTSTL